MPPEAEETAIGWLRPRSALVRRRQYLRGRGGKLASGAREPAAQALGLLFTARGADSAVARADQNDFHSLIDAHKAAQSIHPACRLVHHRHPGMRVVPQASTTLGGRGRSG
jgi:hypothetical protein